MDFRHDNFGTEKVGSGELILRTLYHCFDQIEQAKGKPRNNSEQLFLWIKPAGCYSLTRMKTKRFATLSQSKTTKTIRGFRGPWIHFRAELC